MGRLVDVGRLVDTWHGICISISSGWYVPDATIHYTDVREYRPRKA